MGVLDFETMDQDICRYRYKPYLVAAPQVSKMIHVKLKSGRPLAFTVGSEDRDAPAPADDSFTLHCL